MRLAAMALMLVACTPRAVPPGLAQQPASRTLCPAFVGAEVPDVVVPHIDLAPDPEWDNATPASLEPHFDLARAFGVADWRQACLERGDPRGGDADELLRYLLA